MDGSVVGRLGSCYGEEWIEVIGPTLNFHRPMLIMSARSLSSYGNGARTRCPAQSVTRLRFKRGHATGSSLKLLPFGLVMLGLRNDVRVFESDLDRRHEPTRRQTLEEWPRRDDLLRKPDPGLPHLTPGERAHERGCADRRPTSLAAADQ